MEARRENEAFFLRSFELPSSAPSSRSSSLSSRTTGAEKLISNRILGLRAVFACERDIDDPPAAVSNSNHCSIRVASLLFIAFVHDSFEIGITCDPKRISSVIRGFRFLGFSNNFASISADDWMLMLDRVLDPRTSKEGPDPSFSSSPVFPSSSPFTSCCATAAAAFATSISEEGLFATPRRNIDPIRPLSPGPPEASLARREAVGKSRAFTDCSYGLSF
mmetsp:Transcript_579/g.1697  ORF Transcript_579/g.1697 Transcript_579/m.1697 type:complete len:220 (-) Transcript_579:34-693(-)